MPQKRRAHLHRRLPRMSGSALTGSTEIAAARDEWPKLGASFSRNEVDPKYTLTAHCGNTCRTTRRSTSRRAMASATAYSVPTMSTRTLSARYYKDGSEILLKQKGKRPRRLTPLECARLMGFEQAGRCHDPVSDTQPYRQFGNAVVVPVVRAWRAKAASRRERIKLEQRGAARAKFELRAQMADIVTPEVRSRMMSGIRGKNTKPEICPRQGLHARAFVSDSMPQLPGRPDMVLPVEAVIFVHGCFWHGHNCHLFRWPSSRDVLAREDRRQHGARPPKP